MEKVGALGLLCSQRGKKGEERIVKFFRASGVSRVKWVSVPQTLTDKLTSGVLVSSRGGN